MNINLILLPILLSASLTYGQEKQLELTPLQVVNQRMALYNQHHFEAFIKLYAPDIKIYTYPNQLLGEGIDHMIWIFEPKFASKTISVEIINQIVNGNHVINHEIVTENGVKTKYVSIYEVEDGLIKTVRFVRDK